MPVGRVEGHMKGAASRDLVPTAVALSLLLLSGGGCASIGGEVERSGFADRDGIVVLARPTGAWCDDRASFVVSLRNRGRVSYFVGVPVPSSPVFPYNYSVAGGNDGVGNGVARVHGASCSHVPCGIGARASAVIDLKPGDEISWILELRNPHLTAGAATFQATLHWYGSPAHQAATLSEVTGTVTQGFTVQAAKDTGCFVGVVPASG